MVTRLTPGANGHHVSTQIGSLSFLLNLHSFTPHNQALIGDHCISPFVTTIGPRHKESWLFTSAIYSRRYLTACPGRTSSIFSKDVICRKLRSVSKDAGGRSQSCVAQCIRPYPRQQAEMLDLLRPRRRTANPQEGPRDILEVPTGTRVSAFLQSSQRTGCAYCALIVEGIKAQAEHWIKNDARLDRVCFPVGRGVKINGPILASNLMFYAPKGRGAME